MGEQDTCLAQRLLPDLRQAPPFCHDVTIFCQNSDQFFRTSSLILASISPMLCSALKGVENEEEIVIVIPDSELTIEHLNIFFRSLFNWKLQNSNEPIEKTLALFSIPFGSDAGDLHKDFERASQPEGEGVASGSNRKSFKCNRCELSFSSSKLEKRHSRTVHSENHPHVCSLCGRRCRGPAGWSSYKNPRANF